MEDNPGDVTTAAEELLAAMLAEARAMRLDLAVASAVLDRWVVG